MHVHGVEYDKNKLGELYGVGGVVGSSKGLYPLYDILLRMFRHTIAPSAGNNDDIRGGLVPLLAFAHETYLLGDPAPNSCRIDVMDFIFHEM